MPNEEDSPISQILLQRRFERLIGMKETVALEVKGPTPYDLNTPAGRFELAKDVSAFANSEGGHLLIGFEHERLAEERVDQIKALKMFGRAELNLRQLQGVVSTYVWPSIQGITIEWLQSAEDPDVGIVAIHVPPQREELKFFLVTKVVEGTEPQKEIIVGITRRVGGDNLPFVAQEIYDLIRRGRDTVLQRSIRIEEKLDTLLGRPSTVGVVEADSGAILERRLKLMRER